MKKLLILSLALAMLLSLSSCGVVELLSATLEPPTPPAGVTSVVTSSEDSDASSTDTSSAESSEAEFAMGNVESLTYENKFIGIGCTLDNSWSFYTDEQIRELNNITEDIAGDEYAELIENATIIYDMFAINSNQLDSVNVNLEKINAVQLIALDIAANYEVLFPTMKQTYENMGYTNVTYTIDTVTIEGKDFPSMAITAELNGVHMYQTLFSIKCNGYLANIAITTFENDTTDAILDDFYLTE